MKCFQAMEAARSIFKTACEAVLPHRLVKRAISIRDQKLIVASTGREYPLHKNVYVASFGKAASGMSRAADDVLREHIVDGVVSMPYGTVELFRREGLK